MDVFLKQFPRETEDKEALQSYLSQNFRRIEDGFNQTIQHGTISVTGNSLVTTGLESVGQAVAQLSGAPSAAAAFVRAVPTGIAGEIQIFVYKQDLTVATAAATVHWIAVGE